MIRTVILSILCCLYLNSNIFAKTLAIIEKPGIQITEKDLEKYISYYGPEARMIINDPVKKRRFLVSVTKIFAIASKANKEHFNTQTTIKDEISFLKNKFIAKKYLEYLLQKRLQNINFTKDDLYTYYISHQEEFKVPAEVRFSALVIKFDPKNSKEALKYAKELRKALIKNDICCLKLDNDLYFIKDSGLKSINKIHLPTKITFKDLPLNTWSQPILAANHIYIIKKLYYKPEKIKPFDDVKEIIKKKLLDDTKKQIIKELVANILQEQKVKILYQTNKLTNK